MNLNFCCKKDISDILHKPSCTGKRKGSCLVGLNIQQKPVSLPKIIQQTLINYMYSIWKIRISYPGFFSFFVLLWHLFKYTILFLMLCISWSLCVSMLFLLSGLFCPLPYSYQYLKGGNGSFSLEAFCDPKGRNSCLFTCDPIILSAYFFIGIFFHWIIMCALYIIDSEFCESGDHESLYLYHSTE